MGWVSARPICCRTKNQLVYEPRRQRRFSCNHSNGLDLVSEMMVTYAWVRKIDPIAQSEDRSCETRVGGF